MNKNGKIAGRTKVRPAKRTDGDNVAKRSLAARREAPTGLLDRRVSRLVAIATEVFQELGYEATTLELIADRADVTRRTIYNHFGSKKELFAKIVEATTNQLIQSIDLVHDPKASAEAQLVRYCEAIANEMIQPARIGGNRLMMDMSKKHSMRELRGSKAEPFFASLTRHLDELVRRGMLDIPDTRIAAHVLLGPTMLPSFRLLSGLTTRSTIEPEILRAIHETVRLLCNCYRPKHRND